MTNNTAGRPEPTTLLQRVTLKQVALGTAVVCLLILAFFLLITLRYVLIMLFLGIVVATALSPMFELFRRWGASRNIAAVITFVLLFSLIGGVLTAMVPFFIAQITSAVSDFPSRYSDFRDSLTTSGSRIVRDLALLLPSNPLQSMPNNGASMEEQVAAIVPQVARTAAFGLLIVLLSYYWLYYRALTIQSVALLLPLDVRGEGIEIWTQIETKIGAFVRGLAILSLSIGLLSFVGYSLIGLPYALTIALLGGLLEAVPYVGALVTLAVAVAVGLTVSPEKAFFAFLVANIVQFIEGSIVVPRAMDKTVGVNPVVTLLALAVFAELFGLLGALLAVPLAAAIQVLLDRYLLRAPAPEQLEIGGRDQLALLRYRTQDLASDLRQQLRVKDTETSAESDAEEEELEAVLADLDSVLAAAQGQTT